MTSNRGSVVMTGKSSASQVEKTKQRCTGGSYKKKLSVGRNPGESQVDANERRK